MEVPYCSIAILGCDLAQRRISIPDKVFRTLQEQTDTINTHGSRHRRLVDDSIDEIIKCLTNCRTTLFTVDTDTATDMLQQHIHISVIDSANIGRTKHSTRQDLDSLCGFIIDLLMYQQLCWIGKIIVIQNDIGALGLLDLRLPLQCIELSSSILRQRGIYTHDNHRDIHIIAQELGDHRRNATTSTTISSSGNQDILQVLHLLCQHSNALQKLLCISIGIAENLLRIATDLTRSILFLGSNDHIRVKTSHATGRGIIGNKECIGAYILNSLGDITTAITGTNYDKVTRYRRMNTGSKGHRSHLVALCSIDKLLHFILTQIGYVLARLIAHYKFPPY